MTCEECYTKYLPMLRNLSHKFTSWRVSQEDLMSEANMIFMKCWLKRDDFEHEGQFNMYLYRTTYWALVAFASRNYSPLSVFSRKFVDVNTVELNEPTLEGDVPDFIRDDSDLLGDISKKSEINLIHDCLHSLKPNQRHAVEFKYGITEQRRDVSRQAIDQLCDAGLTKIKKIIKEKLALSHQ